MIPKFTTISRFVLPHEAAIVSALLESEGIECFLRDNLIVQVHNFYSFAIGEVRLQVITENAVYSIELLKAYQYQTEIQAEDVVVLPADTSDLMVCPNCGSPDIETIPFSPDATVLKMILAIIPVFREKNHYRCNSCAQYLEASE